MNNKQIEEQINTKGGQMGIIFNIPTNTVKLELIATVIDEDDKLNRVTTTINLPDIYEARVLGEDWETEPIHYRLSEKAIQLKEQGLI